MTQNKEELPQEYQKAQKQLDKILEQFKTGEITETASKALITPKEGDKRPIDNWSFRNTLMTMITGTTDARGYNQWKKVGRQVKKGSESIRILAPTTYTKELEKGKNDTEIERLRNEGYAKVTKENQQAVKFEIMSGFRAVPVFRYEDTEPIEEFEGEVYKKEEIDYTPDPEQLPELMPLVEKLGVNVEYEADRGLGAKGSYGQDTIKMRTENKQTFYHELAHKAEEELKGSLKKGQDPRQEAVAELSAAVLTRIYEGENEAMEGYSFKYLNHYAQKDLETEEAYDLALKVLGRVEKVLEYIITEAENIEETTQEQKQKVTMDVKA